VRDFNNFSLIRLNNRKAAFNKKIRNRIEVQENLSRQTIKLGDISRVRTKMTENVNLKKENCMVRVEVRMSK
jgi:hypothetical protein